MTQAPLRQRTVAIGLSLLMVTSVTVGFLGMVVGTAAAADAGNITISDIPDKVVTGEAFDVEISYTIFDESPFCSSYQLVVKAVNSGFLDGDTTKIGEKDFTLRSTQVGKVQTTTVEAVIPEHLGDDDGKEEIKVVLDDTCENFVIGPASSGIVKTNIIESNSDPVARFNIPDTRPNPGQTVLFDPASSNDPDGNL